MLIDRAWNVFDMGSHASKQFSPLLDALTKAIPPAARPPLHQAGADVLLSLILVVAGEDERSFVEQFITDELS